MLKTDYKAEFKNIAKRYSLLSTSVNERIVEVFAEFLGWAMEAMQFKLERAMQDMFLSTAVGRPSILAHASDRQYLPIRPMPSTGVMRVDNKSLVQIGLPDRSVFISDNQTYYTLDNPALVDAGTSTLLPISQLKRDILEFKTESENPYIEFLLTQDQSKTLSKYNVYVDEGQGAILWRISHRFRNSSGYDHVYDEFYNEIDQFGIRFGNGSFGKIPVSGSRVVIEAFFSEGASYLSPNSKLHPISDADLSGVDFFSGSAISGGTDTESTESIRKNAGYYYLHDNQTIWNEDYSFFLGQKIPSITWMKFWGEQEQEIRAGGRTVDMINKIYFSVYDPTNTTADLSALAFLNDAGMVNRRFEIAPRVDQSFIVNIAGKIKLDVSISKAASLIEEKLVYYYGKDSGEKRDKVLLQDIYSILNVVGVFSSTTLQVSIDGDIEPIDIPNMVFIDITTTLSRLSLAY